MTKFAIKALVGGFMVYVTARLIGVGFDWIRVGVEDLRPQNMLRERTKDDSLGQASPAVARLLGEDDD